MKKIIIIVVALVLLGGGGFVVWKFFLSEEPAGESEHVESDPAAGPHFVDMEPFIIQVFRDDRVVKNISLTVQIEVAGPDAEEKVQEQMTYLRDAYLKRLHAAYSRGAVGQNYDEAKLKRQLMAQSEDILGPGVITAVLFVNTVENTRSP